MAYQKQNKEWARERRMARVTGNVEVTSLLLRYNTMIKAACGRESSFGFGLPESKRPSWQWVMAAGCRWHMRTWQRKLNAHIFMWQCKEEREVEGKQDYKHPQSLPCPGTDFPIRSLPPNGSRSSPAAPSSENQVFKSLGIRGNFSFKIPQGERKWHGLHLNTLCTFKNFSNKN